MNVIRKWLDRLRAAGMATGEGSPAPGPTLVPARLRRFARPCWVPIVHDRRGAATDSRFGGAPFIPVGEVAPPCGHCGEPLALFVQVDSSALPAAAGKPFGEGLLQVFYCMSDSPHCEVDAEAYLPFSKATLVRVVATASMGGSTETSGKPRFSALAIADWTEVEDFPSADEQEEQGVVLSDAEVDAVAESYPRAGDKLLGWPHWVQSVEYPSCPVCSQRMTYVFQIDSEDNVPHMFGDTGISHVFQCKRHPAQMTLGWACY